MDVWLSTNLAIHPVLSSSLFTSVIFALRASAAFLAKNNPSPTPLWFPILLNGANKSTFSGIPIPSSVTVIIIFSLVFLSLIAIDFSFGVNLIAFWTKFCKIWLKRVNWIEISKWFTFEKNN